MAETSNNRKFETAPSNKLGRKLDTIGWGLCFVWIGIAFLADVGWGVGFLGVGAIILGGVAARGYLSDPGRSGTTKTGC